ncbi:IclR family transcriptional regulator domain-containing protein [Paracoccus zeaxanthinifaciens]|uniref:IclR family transcriptional regulator domain-containing protein n=1 Tax=Paracoccus zeaxanthinifaciens TaxID=187400 RepID=UPI00041B1C91|nr:IclR family transcriptional regulator C-terminal domain-containing protein [Paracoccus zeaxanthinifaciens]
MANRSDIVGSLVKGLTAIEAFSPEHPRMSITDMARATGFDRATARRLLLTLHDAGYADYDGKFFTLTARVLRLGMGALSAMPLPQIMQPWLDQLSDQVGQSASVSILDGTEIVYLARAAQRRVMSINLMPGSRLPAHCTSMGRVLLAALPPDRVRALLDQADLTPRTRFSLTAPDEIVERIEAARHDGYAVIDQEVEIGLRSIAVPLFSAQGVAVAAINVGASAAQVETDALVPRFLGPLRKVQEGMRRVRLPVPV